MAHVKIHLGLYGWGYKREVPKVFYSVILNLNIPIQVEKNMSKETPYSKNTTPIDFKFICIWLLIGFMTSILWGQDSGEASKTVLEEITVIARKREVDLQKAPVAVSVTDGDDLEIAAVSKLDDFNGFIPNLIIAKNDGAGRVVAIRGVGWETAQNLSTQPSVLVYVDGVYLANPLAMGLDLGEIERVEVLRGPQGTEFGQGTTGGSINIITKKSKAGKSGGRLNLSLGDHNLFEGRGSVNLSNSDRFIFSASVQKRSRDGFAEIKGGTYNGYELDDSSATTAHVSLTWEPQDSLSIRLSGYLQNNDQNGAAQKHINDPNPNPRELTQDYPSTFSLSNNSFSGIIEWRTHWGFKITSLTGVQDLEKQQTVDGDRLTSDLTAVNLTGFYPANFDILPYWDNNSRAFSQELNLTGSNTRLDWVVGAYYLDHENYNDFLEAVAPGTPDDYQSQLDNPSLETLPPFQPPLEFVETRTLTRKDSAIYAQGTYRTSERLALTIGGRYQRDKSIDDTTQFWFIKSLQALEDEAFTWKAGIDLDLDENHLFYGLVSTGWKNGGSNPGALNGALDVPTTFKPEEVTSYEIGSKNTFSQGQVRLNATAFYYDYKNFQFLQEDPVPFAGGTGNVPAMTIYGLENELSWRINGHWRLDGQFSISDGKVDSDIIALDPVDFLNSGFGRFTETGVADRTSIRVNLRGNTPPKLVKETVRMVLSHHFITDSGALFRSRLDFIYRGNYQYRIFNNPLVDEVPSYHITSLFFEWELGHTPMMLSLSFNNIFDKNGVNSRYSNPFGLHTTSEEFIPPRQIIARLSYTF